MKPRILVLLGGVLLILAARSLAAAPDIVLADFEGKTYGDWKTTGTAFGEGPAQGTLPGQMEVTGFQGKGLVNSFVGRDGSTGTLTSPEFAVERNYLTFLIGGGGYEGKTCMNLVVGDKVVRTATGPNVNPGGSEELTPAFWDVSEFRGKRARIVIVDNATGGWGHINVDHLVLTDTKPKIQVAAPASREVVISKRYLHLPVAADEARRGGKPTRVSVVVDGLIVREFDVQLSEEPAWYAHLDVGPWQGKTATIRADKLLEGSKALDMIAQADTIWSPDTLYREPLRPQIHFSPRRGWTNDPNGMVYANGEYHLFFQHNPYGWNWGNMHWGHAVSRDLVRWTELPIALYPAKHGDWAFSGSAVVDKDNTSGWKRGDADLLVAAFTSTGRGECIVYSNDNGRTWTEYEHNPVVKHAGRDPRLLWHAPSKQWVMAVYDEHERKKWIAFHTSPDLKTWTLRSRIEGFYECPDLFELPVDQDAKNRKWVLTAADSHYMVGTFDGRAFTPETPKLKGNFGVGFYAAQTFIGDPRGRVVQVGWFRAPSPGMPFNQAMTVPLELRLVGTKDGPRLTWNPVKELEALRTKSWRLGPCEVSPGGNPLADVRGEILEVDAAFTPGEVRTVEFQVRGISITYDVKTQEIVVQKHRAAAPLVNGRQRLRLLVDRTGLELFCGDGRTYVTLPVIPAADERSLSLSAQGGTAKFERLDVHQLGSIWEPARP